MILIVDMNDEKLAYPEFVRPLEKEAEKFSETDTIHYTKVRKSDIERADRIILSGTPLKEFRYLGQMDKFSWLKETGKPVLGICAGMQVMVKIFGSEVIDSKGIGFAEISVKKANPLIEGNLKVYELHGKAVKPSEHFEILAESGTCVHAIKHKTKSMYGILFHPEARNREIISRFLAAKR